MAIKLSELAPVPGSRKKRKVVGRGEGSGHGKTCGRGGKGQTARSGGHIEPGFEGGQMPLYRRVPKVGFVSRKRAYGKNIFEVINLSDLERFDAGTTVDVEALRSSGHKVKHSRTAGVKLLAEGNLTKKLTVKVQAASAAAKAKVEACGGTVEIVAAC